MSLPYSLLSLPLPLYAPALLFPQLQAYYILDELLIAGEQQETSKKNILKLITEQATPSAVYSQAQSSVSNIMPCFPDISDVFNSTRDNLSLNPPLSTFSSPTSLLDTCPSDPTVAPLSCSPLPLLFRTRRARRAPTATCSEPTARRAGGSAVRRGKRRAAPPHAERADRGDAPAGSHR